jgi:hypothetical protein
MNEDLATLESLPPAHRKHVRALFKDQTKKLKARTNRQRYQIIASLLGADGIRQYRELYLDEAGRLFAWYKAATGNSVLANLGIDVIEERILAAYQNALSGEEPDVLADQDPRFHRLRRRGDHLEMEYAYFGALMSVPDGWNEIIARRFRRCIVAVRGEPLTLELRRTPTSMRPALLRSICKDFGIAEPTTLVPCLLKTDDRRDALEKKMDATPHGEKRVGRGKGLGTFSITTDGSVSLLEQIDYLGSQAEHHEVFQRSWWFRTHHNDDYVETAKYFITVETGDLRVSEGISEAAIDNLRRNVLDLF